VQIIGTSVGPFSLAIVRDVFGAGEVAQNSLRVRLVVLRAPCVFAWLSFALRPKFETRLQIFLIIITVTSHRTTADQLLQMGCAA
jgi:hypothetical protein